MSNKLTSKNGHIKDLDNYSKFNNLWILDLSNNMIECVNGLSGFVALGYINLSNNRLSWQSLESIRDLYIVYLELHGNMQLDNDRYYRQQIIDIFPRLFSLDGKFINAMEREETRIFFEKSNFTKSPIRRRVRQHTFRPTTSKSLRLYGKFGEPAIDFLKRFPNNIPINEEWDKKKIGYMAEFIEMYLLPNFKDKLWISNWVNQLLSHVYNVQVISDLYVILVLYWANIEFDLDEDLFQKALDSNNMKVCEHPGLSEYFQLDVNSKIAILCVLLSILSIANVKPKIQSECVVELFHAMENILWGHIRSCNGVKIDELFNKYKFKELVNNYWLSKNLIAAETFMILSKVELFFKELDNRVLNDIIDYATGQEDFIKKHSSSLGEEQQINSIFLVNEALIEIQNNVQLIFSSKNILKLGNNRFIQNQNSISTNSAHKIMKMSESLSRGHTTLKEENEIHKNSGKAMEIGDLVLLGSQMLSNVLSIPTRNSALVQIQKVGSSNWRRSQQNISNHNIAKINPNSFEWNIETGYWIPANSTGDRIFLSKINNKDSIEKKESVLYNNKKVVDLSKISLCDDDTKEKGIDNNEEIFVINTDAANIKENRENCNSRKIMSVQQRKLKSPNFAKLDFSEKNNCLKINTDNKKYNVAFPSPRSPPSSLQSSRRLVTNDAKFWLGNGEYLYKKVWWNSKNPQNIQKRYYIPGWILNDK